MLDEKRIRNIADSILDIKGLPDYVGEVIEELKPKMEVFFEADNEAEDEEK